MPRNPAESGGGGGSDSAGLQVDIRENLDALALFDPEAATDAAGRITVEFDLPDSLTRYRVMAVAVDGAERFGTAESAITAQLPLQVRPSAPRFLNYGDEFDLPIVVQNQTDSAMEVDLVVQTSNLELAGSPGRRVTVPANDRVEVRFPARTNSPGTARFRAVAVSGDHADAQIVALPVYTPATSEAFATYGVVDEGAVVQSIAALRDVIPQFGGLEINTSSTALQALTDAVLYLSDYRYRQLRCLRQPHPGHLRTARRARGLRGRGSRQPQTNSTPPCAATSPNCRPSRTATAASGGGRATVLRAHTSRFRRCML